MAQSREIMDMELSYIDLSAANFGGSNVISKM